MNVLPSPLIPAFIELQDFSYMPLDVRRLRDSGLAARATGDEFMAAVLLWCASWHQQPASSLPDDDIELAALAGYGRVVKEWLKVREGALRGWVKCSDGRLYHPLISEKAVDSWNEKVEHRHKRECDRLRKENLNRKENKLEPLPMPPKPLRISFDPRSGIPSESGKSSVGIPTENSLKGKGEGKGEVKGEVKGEGLNKPFPDGNDAGASQTHVATAPQNPDPPPAPPTPPAEPVGLSAHDAIFQIGVPWLLANGATDKVRSVLGGAEKHLGADAAWLMVQDCMREKPLEPIAWLAASINSRKKIAGTAPSRRGAPMSQAELEAQNDRVAQRVFGDTPREVIDV